MRSALVADLAALPGIEVWVSADARFPVSDRDHVRAVPVRAGEFDFSFSRMLEQVDAVWLVAPETGGVLERLTRKAETAGCAVLGPDSAAVRVLASKRRTVAACVSAGIASVPCLEGEARPAGTRRWVVKPDDGCGCLETFVFDDFETALESWQRDPTRLVLQPFVEGAPASLSIVTDGTTTQVLSVNRQHIAEIDGRMQFDGVSVAAFEDVDGALADMAQGVVRAVPGLRGFFGVDFVLTDSGPILLEGNPRPTTAYVGLRERTGINPAQWILARRRVIERCRP